MGDPHRQKGTEMAIYEVESYEMVKCLSCDVLIDEAEDDPIYCCPECGTNFRRSETENENHRSPCCGKFSSKVADTSCPECEQGEDGFEKVDVVDLQNGDDPFEIGKIGTKVRG